MRTDESEGLMKIGYARVSTDEQNIDMQRRALRRSGCVEIFHDKCSGADFNRPGLSRALERLRAGDTLVIWKLDRLGRSLRRLLEIVGVLHRRRIELESLSERIDTSSPGGLLFFHVMAALAEFERALISERTREGISAAVLRGERIGRRKALSDQELESARLRLSKGERVAAVARSLAVGRSTLYRSLRSPSKRA
jgi:DNA invertase Pin-like site-specific DNA recombinase